MRRGVCGLFAIVAAGLIAPAASAQVLRVGSYNGIPGAVRLDSGGRAVDDHAVAVHPAQGEVRRCDEHGGARVGGV